MTDHKLLLQHSKICLYVAMLLLTQCINLFYLVGAEDKEIIDIAIKNMYFVILCLIIYCRYSLEMPQ